MAPADELVMVRVKRNSSISCHQEKDEPQKETTDAASRVT